MTTTEMETRPAGSAHGEPARYSLARAIPQEVLDREAAHLERLKRASLPAKVLGYLRLSGPGFMGASLIGAGSITAAMLAGAEFEYRSMWVLLVAMVFGVFMMNAMMRFTCKGGFSIIQVQNQYHGWVVGSLLTGLIGTTAVAIIFNFGQYSLGTHALESLAPVLGFEFPRQINWIVYMIVSVWLTLSYGGAGRGVTLVENFMKGIIFFMLIAFGACLVVIGVDWGAMLKGIFVPWLPGGVEGVDLFIASSTAAIGVMDWVLIHYTGLARGWGPRHEGLARFDVIVGLVVPSLLVCYMVTALFAATLYGVASRPETGPELARALAPLLGHTWSQVLLYLGLFAVPVTTTVGMSIAGAMTLHEAMGWDADPRSWRWRLSALLPQIAFLAVWYPRPVWFVIVISAFLSLSNNVVGWSMYLLLNDRRVLGEDRCRSWFWNLGIMLEITLLNALAIVYVYNRLGWWG